METTEITNHKELLLGINLIRIEKERQEAKLKESLKEFASSLNPLSIVKDSLHELARDKEVQLDLGKVGLKLGANFLIDKILGKNSSIKGYLSSLLVEKVSSVFISNNMPKIISGISKLITSNRK